jgi:hypothetical protein
MEINSVSPVPNRRGQYDDVRRTQNGERRDGSGQHADLESQVLGDPGRYGVEYRRRVDASVSRQNCPVSFSSFC